MLFELDDMGSNHAQSIGFNRVTGVASCIRITLARLNMNEKNENSAQSKTRVKGSSKKQHSQMHCKHL